MPVTEEKLNELVTRIVDTVNPIRILLFGSVARREASDNSDIDVLVLVADGSHRRKIAQQIYRNLIGFGIAVDVIVATPADLQRYGSSAGLVYREVLRDGRELYAA